MDPISIMYDLVKRKIIPPIYTDAVVDSGLLFVQKFRQGAVFLETTDFEGDIDAFGEALEKGLPKKAYDALCLREYVVGYELRNTVVSTVDVTDFGKISASKRSKIVNGAYQASLREELTSYYLELLGMQKGKFYYNANAPSELRSTSLKIGHGKYVIGCDPPEAKYTLAEVAEQLTNAASSVQVERKYVGDPFHEQHCISWLFPEQTIHCLATVWGKVHQAFSMDLPYESLLAHFKMEKRKGYVQFSSDNHYAYLEQSNSGKLIPIVGDLEKILGSAHIAIPNLHLGIISHPQPKSAITGIELNVKQTKGGSLRF